MIQARKKEKNSTPRLVLARCCSPVFDVRPAWADTQRRFHHTAVVYHVLADLASLQSSVGQILQAYYRPLSVCKYGRCAYTAERIIYVRYYVKNAAGLQHLAESS